MKKLFSVLLILFISIETYSYAQCNPDFIYSLLGIPGIWPDPNIGIEDAIVNDEYEQTLTVIVPQDTTIDLMDFGFPFSLLVPVNINSFVIDDISGLPTGFTFECGSPNCMYSNGETGCLEITGKADASMGNQSYYLIINLTIEIDLNDYGLGIQSFPYDLTAYELYVRPETSAIDENKLIFTELFSNSKSIGLFSPDNCNYTFEITDMLGKKAYYQNFPANKGINYIHLPANIHLKGVYFLSVYNENKKAVIKNYF
jgi:hypothetical protein